MPDTVPLAAVRQLASILPGSLTRAVVETAVLALADEARRDGALRPAPGIALLLRQLDVSATRHPVATMDPTRWITVAEAAPLAGITERSVQRLAASNRLIARRHGERVWQVDHDSARDYGRNRNS